MEQLHLESHPLVVMETEQEPNGVSSEQYSQVVNTAQKYGIEKTGIEGFYCSCEYRSSLYRSSLYRSISAVHFVTGIERFYCTAARKLTFPQHVSVLLSQ